MCMVDTMSPRLHDKRLEAFHHCVAKLLYVPKRCRLDIFTAVSFLCTRVTRSIEVDCQKLKRLIKYLYGTPDRKLTIGADDINWMNVFIDAAYATHPDMKSHTGGYILFSRGSIMSKSTKQQLNTTSSTEAEFVGCSNFITSAIYASLFLSSQGYEMRKTTLHQDNQSTIKLLVNGRGF